MLQKNSSIFSLKIAIKILHFGHFNVDQLILFIMKKLVAILSLLSLGSFIVNAQKNAL